MGYFDTGKSVKNSILCCIFRCFKSTLFNSGLAKEKAKLRYENRDLKRKNKELKKEIEKLKKRERPNNGKESKRTRIKKGSVKNSDVCIEKWATFSSAALGPAASVIKQVLILFKF